MFGFIVQLETYDVRLVLVRHTGVTVHMIHKLPQITLGGGYAFGTIRTGLTEFLSQTVGFLTRAIVVQWGDEQLEAPVLHFFNRVVQQTQVVVCHQIPQSVGDFGIPDVYPVGLQPQTGEMVHIFVHTLVER